MQPADRRFFLKSLLASSVGYCFLSSVPIVGQEVSRVLVRQIGAQRSVPRATLEMGDVFTIAGVYSINPATGRPTRFLQQFVAT